MSKKVCSTESLHLALFWEEFRADWLHQNQRLTEAQHAEEEAARYRFRIRKELDVEVG